MKNIRTDLALEAHEIKSSEEKSSIDDISGVHVEKYKDDQINISRIKIENNEGAEALGKPIGNYITIEASGLKIKDQVVYENVINVIKNELSKLININKDDNVLVVGLGNWKVTPDSLGPKVVSNIMITRHLKEYIPDKIDENIRPVCALAPGVLGITGIETGEIVKGVVDKIKPSLVIVIDALASRRMDRVSTTIQIADTGISPGSGIGNKRMSINYDNLGVPVIAIGVPTVVDAATMANDTIDLIVDSMIEELGTESAFYKVLRDMKDNEKLEMIKSILKPYSGNLIVTPKEIDVLMEDVSVIVADGINQVLQSGISKDDIHMFKQLQ